jgi:hypothetical protein
MRAAILLALRKDSIPGIWMLKMPAAEFVFYFTKLNDATTDRNTFV